MITCHYQIYLYCVPDLKLSAFCTKIPACFMVFTTWRFFSSSHFYDRNKNISLMLAYNPQLILWYLLYMKANKWKCMQKQN